MHPFRPLPVRHAYVCPIRRPSGMPVPEDFALRHAPLPELAAGQVLVENTYLSVDPYMRECMDEEWVPGAAPEGRSIGRVLASRAAALPEGARVFHRAGWRSHAVLDAAACRRLPDVAGIPDSAWLGVLGGTGLTAYVALTRIAPLEAGASVLVSAAGGGVGTAAAGMARLMGAGLVAGTTGSPQKARQLCASGLFDLVADYHDPSAEQILRARAPEGYAIALENVGGNGLGTTISLVREGGQIAWVGAVSLYNGGGVPAPANLYDMVGRSLTLRGFLVRDYRAVQSELEAWAIPHLQAGRLRLPESVSEGMEGLVPAFIGMLGGQNTGKTLVRLAGTVPA